MAVDIEATDYFSGTFTNAAFFHPQSSSFEYADEARNFLDATGNVECETMVATKQTYRTSYKYCNPTPAIGTDLGTALSTFGEYLAGPPTLVITSMTITFNAGDYAEVEIEGCNYYEDDGVTEVISADIGNSDVSAAVPAGAGFGVPELAGVTLGTDASPTSLTLTFNLDHKATEGADGFMFTTKNITPEVTASAEYVGVPTTIEPVTNWTTDSYENTDANDDFDAASWNGHRYFDLAT